MPKIATNVLAVLAGILIGSLVNMGIILVGPMIIPLPEGVDMADMDRFAENLNLLQPVNFITPWVAHALGTFFGGLVTSKLAASQHMKLALGIGAFFLLGGISVVLMYGGPLWFACVDLLGAYFPMAYLGGLLGRPKHTVTDDLPTDTGAK